jgi:RHS repeat-associated protein
MKNGENAVSLTSKTDYYPFGMPMPNRNDGANSYRYAFQGQEKDSETGKEAFELRLWDSRIGRWLTTDPASQYSSPYLGMGNNPINGTDPDGGKWFKEYKNADAYYAENPNGKLDGSDGHWLSSDRTNRTDVWNTANLTNLQNADFGQYQTIAERGDFYGWFQSTTESLGFETKWAGAAFVVASQMKSADFYSFILSDDVVSFANAGNEAIFNNVLPKLKNLYNGPILTGANAHAWDVKTLTVEQRDVVHPIYLLQSVDTQNMLSKMAKGEGMFVTSPELRFDGNNVLNWEQRFNHGMQKAVPFWNKYGRKTYCSWCN